VTGPCWSWNTSAPPGRDRVAGKAPRRPGDCRGAGRPIVTPVDLSRALGARTSWKRCPWMRGGGSRRARRSKVRRSHAMCAGPPQWDVETQAAVEVHRTGLDRLRGVFQDLVTAEDRHTFERLARDPEVASADDSTARGLVTLRFLDPGSSPGIRSMLLRPRSDILSTASSKEPTVCLCRRIIPACTRRTSAGPRDPGGTPVLPGSSVIAHVLPLDHRPPGTACPDACHLRATGHWRFRSTCRKIGN